MATNFFFNNFQSSMEQNLIEDLVVESIKIYGIDLYYLPKRITARDTIFREEELATYNTAHPIEMYIKNVDGFEGEGDFISKFGLEIRDRITFTVSRRSFAAEVLTQESGMLRPLEGDLIWFPLTRKMYKIKFVEHEAIFYQLGSLQTWDLTCEFDVDINTAIATSVTLTDVQAQNETFEADGQSGILDFSEIDPFSEGNNY